MELELGLKITHSRDDITSHSNLQLNKNYGGPLFISRETDTNFFLIAYLKGFRRENIDIKINEDGKRIVISGTRAVQEMVLSGYVMQRKEVELRAFRKVFQIPDGVILDKIKAKFKDEDSSLTIIMPKSEKGMLGLQIEEVKEESTHEIEKPDEIAEAVSNEPEKQESGIHEKDEEPEQEQDGVKNETAYGAENKEVANDEEEGVEKQERVKVERQKSVNNEVKGDKRETKLCPPLVAAGSAILVSLVVLVIGFIRAKRRKHHM